MASKKQSPKIGKVMHEWKTGTLHSGKGGPVVKSKKQAIAIAISEAMSSQKKKPMHRMPNGKMMSGAKHESKESSAKKRTERKTGKS